MNTRHLPRLFVTCLLFALCVPAQSVAANRSATDHTACQNGNRELAPLSGKSAKKCLKGLVNEGFSYGRSVAERAYACRFIDDQGKAREMLEEELGTGRYEMDAASTEVKTLRNVLRDLLRGLYFENAVIDIDIPDDPLAGQFLKLPHQQLFHRLVKEHNLVFEIEFNVDSLLRLGDVLEESQYAIDAYLSMESSSLIGALPSSEMPECPSETALEDEGVFEIDRQLKRRINAISGAVTVRVQLDDQVTVVPLKNLSVTHNKKTLRKLGVFDRHRTKVRSEPIAEINAIRLTGPKGAVAATRVLIEDVDKAWAYYLENAPKSINVECQRKWQEALNQRKPKVIPLQYATVGATTQTFQGERVTIPGVEETLYAMLGLEQPRPSEKQEDGSLPVKKVRNNQPVTFGATNGCLPPPIITTDPRTNSVVVTATAEQIAEIRATIEELDKPQEMVELEVLIVEAEAGFSNNLGVQLGTGKTNGPGKGALTMATGSTASNIVLDATATNRSTTTVQQSTGGAETTTVTQSLGGAVNSSIDPLTLLPAVTGIGGVTASMLIGDTASGLLSAHINALASENRAHIISSPTVVTMNNLAAKVTSTQKKIFKISTGEGEEGNVKTYSAGISLDITPSILRRNRGGIAAEKQMVMLHLNAKNANFQDDVNSNEKEVQTHAMVPEGATFVLAGLFSSNRSSNDSGVPGLKDIPLLGALFSNNESTHSTRETVFIITPRIIKWSELAAQAVGDDPYQVAPKGYAVTLRQSAARDRRALRRAQSEESLTPPSALLEEDQ